MTSFSYNAKSFVLTVKYGITNLEEKKKIFDQIIRTFPRINTFYYNLNGEKKVVKVGDFGVLFPKRRNNVLRITPLGAVYELLPFSPGYGMIVYKYRFTSSQLTLALEQLGIPIKKAQYFFGPQPMRMQKYGKVSKISELRKALNNPPAIQESSFGTTEMRKKGYNIVFLQNREHPRIMKNIALRIGSGMIVLMAERTAAAGIPERFISKVLDEMLPGEMVMNFYEVGYIGGTYINYIDWVNWLRRGNGDIFFIIPKKMDATFTSDNGEMQSLIWKYFSREEFEVQLPIIEARLQRVQNLSFIRQIRVYTSTDTSMGRNRFIRAINYIDMNDLTADVTALNNRANDAVYSDYPYVMVFSLNEPIEQENVDSLFTGNENCVIKIAALMGKRGYDNITRAIYNKFPHLEEENTGVQLDEIKEIAKSAQIDVCIYTPLALHTDVKPWFCIRSSRSKNKTVHIIAANQHATIKSNRAEIDKVVYFRDVQKLNAKKENSVTACYNGQDWFIDVVSGQNVMHKVFRPSEWTKNESDDSNQKYFGIISPHSLFVKKLKEKYDLEPTRKEYLDLIKSSERFIGNSSFPLSQQGLRKNENCNCSQHIQIDHNKSFVSYKTCSYYMGFPTNYFALFTDFRETQNMQPAFVIVKSYHVVSKNPKLQDMLYMNNTEITEDSVLPYPEFKFLNDVGVRVEPKMYLYSKMQDIDIINFTRETFPEENKEKKRQQRKLLRNAAIGYLISGGLEDKKLVHLQNMAPIEKKQIEYECFVNKWQFIPDLIEEDKADVILDSRPTGCFHFHSYIMCYSRIAVMQKFLSLERVCGFHADALIVPFGDLSQGEKSKKLGGWKTEPFTIFGEPKPLNKPRVPQIPKKIENNQSPLPSIVNPNTKILITGPAGVGKTHLFKNMGKQCILLEYTKEQRDQKQEEGFAKVKTFQKYFQPSASSDVFDESKKREIRRRRFKHRPIVVIDEVFMLSQFDLQVAIHECEKDKSILICLGDPCQIRNSISTPISDNDLKDFSHVQQIRNSNIPARHNYEYGLWLDSLRDKPYEELKQIVIREFPNHKGQPFHFGKTKILSGNWNRIRLLNKSIAKNIKSDVIPVRRLRDNKKKFKCRDSDKIWWDKKKFTEQIPADKKYIPFMATTIDSFQGSTCESLVVDVDTLDRPGALYTAITRTREKNDTYVIFSAK